MPSRKSSAIHAVAVTPSTVTFSDLSIERGLLWPPVRLEPVATLRVEGLAGSPTARRLECLFASHEDAGRPSAQRLAAFAELGRLVVASLPRATSRAARDRRLLLLHTLGMVTALVDANGEPGDVAELAELERRLDAFGADAAPELRAVRALIGCQNDLGPDAHGLGACLTAALLLSALAELAPVASFEWQMQRAAELAYRHLFADPNTRL